MILRIGTILRFQISDLSLPDIPDQQKDQEGGHNEGACFRGGRRPDNAVHAKHRLEKEHERDIHAALAQNRKEERT